MEHIDTERPPELAARRELAEEIGLVTNAPLQLVGEVDSVRGGRVFLFVLRLDRLPTLQLDNREILAQTRLDR